MRGPQPASAGFPKARITIVIEPLDGSQGHTLEVYQAQEALLDVELAEPVTVEDEYIVTSTQAIDRMTLSLKPLRREDGAFYEIRRIVTGDCPRCQTVRTMAGNQQISIVHEPGCPIGGRR